MTDTEAKAGPVQHVLANGIQICYEQAGTGPPLVLVHGLMGNMSDWRHRVLPMLTGRFRVLIYDLRGHGDTDMTPSGYTSADMVADLIGLMDQLGIAPADLVGHSFGGTVALHATALHPERVNRLTISDSRIRALQPPQRLKDWAYWPTWKAQLQQAGITLDEESELDFAVLDLLTRQRPSLLQLDRKRELKWKELLASTTAMTDLRDPAGLTADLIRSISTPVQAVYGELSPCLPSLEALREILPSVKSVVAPGLGHFFPITKPALFVDYIKSFHAPASADPKSRAGEAESTEPDDQDLTL
jgi:pimeloyl-ACP methyl ester carboxylesterase